MFKLKCTIFLLAGFLFEGETRAQQSCNSSGVDAVGANGTMTYSIGQMIYNVHSDNSGSLAQGVQQPYEIFKSDISESGKGFSVLIFPNPTADRLILDILDFSSEKLSYLLYDGKGSLLLEKQIQEKQTHIDMGILPSSQYQIQIINKTGKAVQTFKIIKN